MIRCLIAEDDIALGAFLRRGLEQAGYEVYLSTDGGSAVRSFQRISPDLTILDLNLPVKNGEEVLKEIRAFDGQKPILVLTAQTGVETCVRCLDLGADDWMLKPFSLAELRARCRALLRRGTRARVMLRAADLELDRLNRTTARRGKRVDLTRKEFGLLEHLLLNRGHCVSRSELLEEVWKLEPAQSTNIVDVYINYLRKKLDDMAPGDLIRTVRGQGYMIAGEASAEFKPGIPGVDQVRRVPPVSVAPWRSNRSLQSA